MSMTSIIHLEDNPLDHKLVAARLVEDGFQFQITHVDTRQAFLEAIKTCSPDLILGDYSLPQFDGLSALKLARQQCPNVPFIILSGAMGEIAAVEVLKAGATDYVLKDHLERLGPAVRRALDEAAERAAHQAAQRQVREARDLAEAANRAKDHFLAVLSHELRTPLTPALTAIQIIEADPTLPAEFREAVQMIRRNVQLEVKLIDDLLDLTRVTKGKLELNLHPTDVHEAMRQVMGICESDLRGKRMTVQMNLNAANPTCAADPARLQQILWNILKNAVKFTDEGGQIVLSTRNTPQGHFELSVADNGIGMEPEVLSRIFDAFEQGGKQITRQFGGLGLGLAISRALADQHGGSLHGSSEGLGKGSVFTLSLPVTKRSPAASAKPGSNGQVSDTLAQCRILLVDDHLDTARAMGKLLRQWGCDVQIADSVASALKAADANPFDVLISDIGLPDGSGIDLMRQLRTRNPVRGIAVSGFGMDEDLRQSKSAGFCEHLVKPIDLDKLQTTLRRVLATSQI
jgi:signal transduction histidine kinase